ncbi:MAG: hypothetical protein GXO47_09325 [Chlorobi bacterium]|nr:hypothetical protein [Chlorobiota bacterium]
MYRILIIFTALISAINISGQNISGPLQIDSIVIKKNWRTKDKIIKRELEFRAGQTVTQQMLDESIKKIWNMKNFADVSFVIDTIDDKTTLILTAKDAFTIVPVLSFRGNKKDFHLTMGINDQNFLGRNINLSIMFSTGTNGKTFHFGTNIPRQLLYKNMNLSGYVSYGYGVHNKYDADREQISSVGYRLKSFSINIGNPWHTDFKYTFSPNLSFNLFQHKTDTTLATSGIPTPNDYTVNYFSIGISESTGTITHIRHQEDGYNISVNTGFGIGLDNESPYFQSFGLSASYHKLFNSVIQISALFRTAYTTSETPSLKYNLGSHDVKGILQGEISGKAYYTTYIGGGFTYINKKWFALEHTVYINWGNGKDIYPKIFTTSPLFAAGTSLNFLVPMIPWLYIKFFFSYSGKNSNWFNIEF